MTVELRRRREVEDALELAHEVHLTAALEDVHALGLRLHRIAVEIGGALLELGKVFHCLERALGAEQPLHIHAAQRRRVDAVAMLVGADIADRVRRRIGVAVGMAIEAGHSLVRLQGTPVWRLVELRLGKRRHQQPDAFQLLRIENVLEDFVKILEGDELAL